MIAIDSTGSALLELEYHDGTSGGGAAAQTVAPPAASRA
jgi:hypothetical protein